ncbi:cholinesterase 2 [Aedes aegypti]|uniref:Carboxylic ester hydrolase n=2 Tax=Aedes aegypti TaxID=7159 RepID=A0A1S4EW56_AEDAE|nr:cholinesterase 2 [Aedes aegypti]
MHPAALVFAILSCAVQSVTLECVVRFSKSASGIGILKNTFENSEYCVYLGIRYGTFGRFQPSQLLEPKDHQNYTAQGSVCPQLDDINYPTQVLGEEDCLFLNVYSPEGANDTSLFAVLVFIHGGSFTIGSAGYDVHGVDLLIGNNIVIVTINYRLDVLGFLRYPKFNITGNYGLLDQRTALQWVRQYINCFGGDPNRITLMGHSAGASSINYHMYSDQSAGLFHQAILQSGTFLMPHAFIYEPEKYAEFYFTQMGVSTRDQLLDRDFRDYFFLNDTSRMLGTVFASMQFPCFLPAADGLSISESPHQLILQNMSRSDIPLLVGTTSTEFLLLLDYVKDYFSWDENFPNRDNKTVLEYVEGVIHAMAAYAKETGLVTEKEQFFRDLANYANMIFPADNFVEKMLASERKSPIYRYRFGFEGKFGWYKNEFYRTRMNTSRPGVVHGDDLGYIFTPYNVREALEQPENYRKEWYVHRMLAKAIACFVKHGNPSTEHLHWKPVNAAGENVVYIGDEMVSKTENNSHYMANFWKRIHDCYYYYRCSRLEAPMAKDV